MIWIALAILLGILAFVIAGVWAFRQWLEFMREQDDPDPQPARGGPDEDDDEDEIDDDVVVDVVRTGSADYARMQVDQWRAEKRAEGLSEREIDEILAQREPILFL